MVSSRRERHPEGRERQGGNIGDDIDTLQRAAGMPSLSRPFVLGHVGPLRGLRRGHPGAAARVDHSGGAAPADLGMPPRPCRDILDDLKRILQRIYDPAAYFGRVRRVVQMLDRPPLDKRRSTELMQRTFGISLRELVLGGRIISLVVRRHRNLLRHFLAAWYGAARKNPQAVHCVFTATLFFCHLGPFARHVLSVLDRRLEMLPVDEHGIERLPAAVGEAELAAADD